MLSLLPIAFFKTRVTPQSYTGSKETTSLLASEFLSCLSDHYLSLLTFSISQDSWKAVSSVFLPCACTAIEH